MEDLSTFVGIVVTIAIAIIGGLLNMIFGKIEAQRVDHDLLETRLENHRLYAAENFTTKKDVKDAKDEIIEKLKKIENKLWS
jgi:uncharacterized membrane protein YraQ (UPF0718 family)